MRSIPFQFIEVEPIHEEMLRKKEEQDRTLPERHLYRFHHMNMWTKLRPGIWNFLEKVCCVRFFFVCRIKCFCSAVNFLSVMICAG